MADHLRIEKVQLSKSISIIGCSNYASATGAIGYWARKITDRGYIGIVMSQCNEMVAPYGSYEPIFGTNPIAIGVPLDDDEVEQIVFDMATSAEAFFGIMLASVTGTSIQDDVAYDRDGKETTDPDEALKGALRVFDRGHKGSGIALMIELLAGALTGASMGPSKLDDKNWGSLVVAIDPGVFGDAQAFKRKALEMCSRVKQAKRLDGDVAISLPGERSDKIEKLNTKRGFVVLPQNVVQKMRDFLIF